MALQTTIATDRIEDNFSRTSMLAGFAKPKTTRFLLNGEPYIGPAHPYTPWYGGGEQWWTGINRTKHSQQLEYVPEGVPVELGDDYADRDRRPPRAMELVPTVREIDGGLRSVNDEGSRVPAAFQLERREPFNATREVLATDINPEFRQRLLDRVNAREGRRAAGQVPERGMSVTAGNATVGRGVATPATAPTPTLMLDPVTPVATPPPPVEDDLTPITPGGMSLSEISALLEDMPSPQTASTQQVSAQTEATTPTLIGSDATNILQTFRKEVANFLAANNSMPRNELYKAGAAEFNVSENAFKKFARNLPID